MAARPCCWAAAHALTSLFGLTVCFDPLHCPSRKSSSWHTSLRIRKKSEKKEKEAKKETKLENGYRKSRDGLANKVSVKVSSPIQPRTPPLLSASLHIFQTDGVCSSFSASKSKLHLRW